MAGGVPEAILNHRSPRAGLPECGRSPHEGRPGRGEWSLSMAEGTPCLEVLFLLHPFLYDIILITLKTQPFDMCRTISGLCALSCLFT